MKKLFLPLLALALAALPAAAAVPPAEKLLPDDTLAVYAIPDFARVMAYSHDAPQAQLWSDPALKPFKDKLLDKIKSEFITPLERELGVHFDDYANLPQGQLTLAVIQNGWQGKDDDANEPAVVLLLDARDKSAQLKTILADLRKKWVDAGKTVKTEKIRDVDFSVITLSSNDVPKTLAKVFAPSATTPDAAPDEKSGAKSAAKAQIYIGQTDSLLLICNSPKALEKILAAAAGGSVKSLADVPAFAANQATMFRDAQVFGWINTRAFVDVVSHLDDKSPASDPSGGMGMPKPDKIITALGFKGLRAIAFNSVFSVNDGVQVNFLLNVPADSRTGLFKILAGEPKDVNPPPFIPADAVKFQRWRIDGQKTWATIKKMVSDVDPSLLNNLDFLIQTAQAPAKEKDPSFDLEKSLFGNLGDDYITYQKKPKGNSLEEMSSPPALVLIGSPNAEQLASSLKTVLLLVSPSGAPTERDFLGRKIYTIPFPGAPAAAGGSASRSLSYASSGGYLAISADAPSLEEYLRSSQGGAKSLRDTTGLADATSKITGPGTSLFGYANDSENMRAFFAFLKKDSSGGMGGFGQIAAMLGAGDGFKDWIDISLLPSFDKVSKYFYFSVYSGGATADGLTYKFYAPVPPALKK